MCLHVSSKMIGLGLNAKQRAHLSHTKKMLCGRCWKDAPTDVEESVTPEDYNALRLVQCYSCLNSVKAGHVEMLAPIQSLVVVE